MYAMGTYRRPGVTSTNKSDARGTKQEKMLFIVPPGVERLKMESCKRLKESFVWSRIEPT